MSNTARKYSLDVNQCNDNIAIGVQKSICPTGHKIEKRIPHPKAGGIFMSTIMVGVRGYKAGNRTNNSTALLYGFELPLPVGFSKGTLLANFNANKRALDMTSKNLLSLSDINTTVNHEPRILDVRLAEALGFSQPRDIRKILTRHRGALDRLGTIATVETMWRGRPATEYYLTKKQAIYITAKSETENAVDLTIHVIEVFDAAMNGEAHPALPKTTTVRAHERKLPEKPDARLKQLNDEYSLAVQTLEQLARQVEGLTYIHYHDALYTVVMPALSMAQQNTRTLMQVLSAHHKLAVSENSQAQQQLQLAGRA